MTAIKRAVLFDLQATRGAPLIFSGGVILVLALSALKLNNISGHVPYPVILKRVF
jgi:hypothetical protein